MIMIRMSKIITTLGLFAVIYLKPFYAITIFIFFIGEYFYILRLFIELFNRYFDGSYTKIEIKDEVLFRKNIIELWYHYLKMNAFNKVYSSLSKKRFSLNTIIISLFILLFSIPFRFLKIIYYFVYIC